MVAVESLAENVAYLKRHMDLKGVRNVEVWPAAVADKVADKEGEEPFVLLEIAARARSGERAAI